MRPRTLYLGLAGFALACAATAAVLAGLALFAFAPLSTGAAALCGVLFLVPGLAFLAQVQRLRLMETALAHVATLAAEAGSLDMETLGRRLEVPPEDAARILRRAVREGYVQGTFDVQGRFVVAKAPTINLPAPSIGRG